MNMKKDKSLLLLASSALLLTSCGRENSSSDISDSSSESSSSSSSDTPVVKKSFWDDDPNCDKLPTDTKEDQDFEILGTAIDASTGLPAYKGTSNKWKGGIVGTYTDKDGSSADFDMIAEADRTSIGEASISSTDSETEETTAKVASAEILRDMDISALDKGFDDVLNKLLGSESKISGMSSFMKDISFNTYIPGLYDDMADRVYYDQYNDNGKVTTGSNIMRSVLINPLLKQYFSNNGYDIDDDWMLPSSGYFTLPADEKEETVVLAADDSSESSEEDFWVKWSSEIQDWLSGLGDIDFDISKIIALIVPEGSISSKVGDAYTLTYSNTDTAELKKAIDNGIKLLPDDFSYEIAEGIIITKDDLSQAAAELEKYDIEKFRVDIDYNASSILSTHLRLEVDRKEEATASEETEDQSSIKPSKVYLNVSRDYSYFTEENYDEEALSTFIGIPSKEALSKYKAVNVPKKISE